MEGDISELFKETDVGTVTLILVSLPIKSLDSSKDAANKV